MPENPVNLHEVDGDSRKMIAVRRLVRKYPDAFDYWHKSGIDERLPEGKHKHGVLGHQLGGAMAVEAIGGLLEERGVLNQPEVENTVRANLIHDADKTTDMQFIIMAMGGKDGKGEVSWARVEEIVRKTDLPNKGQVLDDLRKDYGEYMDPGVELGDRVHVARAMIAGRVHKERLARAGFSPQVIDLQGATEYTGCDEVDRLLDIYDQLLPADQAVIVQKCIINYVDNGMKESELVPVEDRTEAVFAKPINVALSKAYVNWNDKGETARDKQNRVGKRVEAFLAGLAGVGPKDFLSVVESKMRRKIAGV